MIEINDTKAIVEDVLETYPHTRNNDDLLRRKVWELYGEGVNGSTVERVRREIQLKEHRLLPTDPTVLFKRFNRQKEFRRHYINTQMEDKYFQEVIYEVH